MAKTTKGASKTAAKIAKGKAKVARKCGKAAKAVAVTLFASALFAAGCMGTTTPSRSQTLCIKDCTINVYGCGTETNEVPRIELATQAMSIDNSGTETQTTSPTNTTDIKPQTDVNTTGGRTAGILETALQAGASALMSKSSGTGSAATAPSGAACADGSCTPGGAVE